MKPLKFKAYTLINRRDCVCWDRTTFPAQPILAATRRDAEALQSIDNERIVRVLVTITAAKQKRAKRGRR